jgi:hypothetical protein
MATYFESEFTTTCWYGESEINNTVLFEEFFSRVDNMAYTCEKNV